MSPLLSQLAGGQASPLSTLTSPQAGPNQRMQAMLQSANPNSGFQVPGGPPVAAVGQQPTGQRIPTSAEAPSTPTKLPGAPPAPKINYGGALSDGATAAAVHVGAGVSGAGGAGLGFDGSDGYAGMDDNDLQRFATLAGMGARGSPYFGVDAGAGALAGMQAVQARQAARAELALKQAQAADFESQAAYRAQQTKLGFLPYQMAGLVGDDGTVNTNGPSAPQVGPPGGGAASPAATAAQPYLPPGITPDIYNITTRLARAPSGTPMGDAAKKQLQEWAAMDPAYKGSVKENESEGEGKGKINSGTFVLNQSKGDTIVGPHGVATGAAPPASTPAPAAGGSPPAPGAAAPANPYSLLPVPQPLPAPTNVAMTKEQEGQAEALGKLPKEIDDAAATAVQSNLIYNNMRAAQSKIMTGKGSDLYNNANAYLVQGAKVLNKMGLVPDATVDSMGDQVSNFQDLKKNQVVLTGAATKAVSPRASTQELNYLSQGVPGNEMTDQAFDMITGQLQGVQDFALAQQKAKSMWLANPANTTHTMNGFESWFNNNVDPAVFALARMNPNNAAELINNLKRLPNGQAMTAKIAKQMQMAHHLNLFPEE